MRAAYLTTAAAAHPTSDYLRTRHCSAEQRANEANAATTSFRARLDETESQLEAVRGLQKLTQQARDASEQLASERETELKRIKEELATARTELNRERTAASEAAAAADARERGARDKAVAAEQQRDLEVSILRSALEKTEQRVQAQLASLPDDQQRRLAHEEERLRQREEQLVADREAHRRLLEVRGVPESV